MSLSRILKMITAVIGVVVVAVVLYLLFADLSKYRPTIENAVAEATGREFRINGTLELDVLPSPSIVMEDVTLTNAEWGSDRLMLKIGHLSARVGLWSLLSGPVEVREFRLRDTSALLETNADGAGNWEMAPAEAETEPKPESGDAELPLIIEYAEIRNTTLTYRQPEADDQIVDIADLTMEPNESGSLGLAGTGSVLGLAFALTGEIATLEALKALDAISYKLNGNLGSLDYRIDGQTTEPQTFNGTTLKALFQTEAIEDLPEALGTESPVEGPMKVEADLAKSGQETTLKATASLAEVTATVNARAVEESITFDASVATLDKVGDLLDIAGLPAEELTLSGSLAVSPDVLRMTELMATLGTTEARASGTIARGVGESALEFEASGPSLAQLRQDLPEIPFTLKTSASLTPESIALAPLALTFGDSDLTGDIKLGTAKPSAIDIRLQSKLIDMTPFVKKDDDAKQAEAEDEEEEPKSQYVFSDEKFALDALRETEADIDATIARFVMDTLELTDIKTTAALHDGRLDVKQTMAAPGGGQSQSEIVLDAAGEQAELDMLTLFSDLRLNIASGENADPATIPTVSITMDIAATGDTPHAMASSTTGRLLLTQGPGRVENKLVGRFSGDLIAQLFGALNPLSKEEEYSNWECSVFAIDFVEGLGEISGFLLQGEKLMIVGGGDIDLNTEKLNIEFNTKPRKGVGVSMDMFVTPFVKLGGTLASPSVGLNKKGVLLSGGAAIMTGGLSFLFQGAADRATAEAGMCEKTMTEVGPHGALDQSTGIKPQPE